MCWGPSYYIRNGLLDCQQSSVDHRSLDYVFSLVSASLGGRARMSLEPQAGISSYFLAHATGGLGTHHMVELQIAVCLCAELVF